LKGKLPSNPNGNLPNFANQTLRMVLGPTWEMEKTKVGPRTFQEPKEFWENGLMGCAFNLDGTLPGLGGFLA